MAFALIVNINKETHSRIPCARGCSFQGEGRLYSWNSLIKEARDPTVYAVFVHKTLIRS